MTGAAGGSRKAWRLADHRVLLKYSDVCMRSTVRECEVGICRDDLPKGPKLDAFAPGPKRVILTIASPELLKLAHRTQRKSSEAACNFLSRIGSTMRHSLRASRRARARHQFASDGYEQRAYTYLASQYTKPLTSASDTPPTHRSTLPVV